MKLSTLKIPRTAAWIVVGALLAGCSGGAQTSLPAAGLQGQAGTSGATGAASSGNVAVQFHVNAPTKIAGTTGTQGQRSPQYVSGYTEGVYIKATSNTSGATTPITVYADVAGSAYNNGSGTKSPLCTYTNNTDDTGGVTCSISLNATTGATYTITAVALNAEPSGLTSSSGLGTGFAGTAKELSVGSTSTTITSGQANSISILLNPIPTQIATTALAITSATGGGTQNTFPTVGSSIPIVAAATLASYATTKFTFTASFELGDAATNLITKSSTEVFAAPDGTTTNVAAALNVPGSQTDLTAATNSFTVPTSGGTLTTGNYSWDGTALEDTTGVYGVPIPLTFSTGVGTQTPLIGDSTAGDYDPAYFTVTGTTAAYLAPFEIEPTSASGSTNGNAVTLTGYLYSSGGSSTFSLTNNTCSSPTATVALGTYTAGASGAADQETIAVTPGTTNGSCAFTLHNSTYGAGGLDSASVSVTVTNGGTVGISVPSETTLSTHRSTH